MINRDGAQISLWQHTVEPLDQNNQNGNNSIFDVIIVGGGITGLTTALLLQQQGKRCVLAEAHNLGFGTTGGTTAHLNTILDIPYYQIQKDFGEDDAKIVAEGTREAIGIVERLVREYQIDCGFERKAACLYAQTPDEADELQKIVDAAREVGVDASWAEETPVPIPFVKAAIFSEQAQMHPTRYIFGLAKAFAEAGGIILEQCHINDVKAGGLVTAYTSTGDLRASSLVYATHLPPGLNIFNFRCAPYRSYAAAFVLSSGQYPDGLAYDLKDPYHYFRSQETDGNKYLIAGGYDHKTGHNENTGHSFLELEAYVKRYFGDAEAAYKWSSQYYESDDGLPYIGAMPEQENVYVATGYGGNGITLGTLAGRIISDLIVTGSSKYADVFEPSRVKMVAGFRNFVKENADVAVSFVKRRFSFEQLEQLASLAPGEAAIAEFEGKKVGIYKNEDGKVQMVNPTCAHAGCIVAWNAAEKTWDCPCHGARYSPDGECVTGPAKRDLEQIALDAQEQPD